MNTNVSIFFLSMAANIITTIISWLMISAFKNSPKFPIIMPVRVIRVENPRNQSSHLVWAGLNVSTKRTLLKSTCTGDLLREAPPLPPENPCLVFKVYG